MGNNQSGSTSKIFAGYAFTYDLLKSNLFKGVAAQAKSIFGAGIQVQAISGVSATSIAGGLIIAVVVVGACYFIYTRLSKSQNDDDQVIEQRISNRQLNNQQLYIDYRDPTLPQWTKIKMTKKEFISTWKTIRRYFNKDYFEQRVDQLKCQYSTYAIMRQPCKMKCCKNIKKDNGYAEKTYLQLEIERRGRCLICQSPAKHQYIQFDGKKFEEINGFRQSLAAFYLNQKANDKKIWKKLIDRQFGKGYTEQHLDNFKFS